MLSGQASWGWVDTDAITGLCSAGIYGGSLDADWQRWGVFPMHVSQMPLMPPPLPRGEQPSQPDNVSLALTGHHIATMARV